MKKIMLAGLLLFVIMAGITNVDAELIIQSRPDAAAYVTVQHAQYSAIRKMEELGQVMGLNATIQNDRETSTSNNIDVHLCKSTEWGGAAMLSVSQYGAGNGNISNTKNYKGNASASTTGNWTGVFGMNGGLTSEYVAAGAVGVSYPCYIGGVENRHIDKYTSSTTYIVGDATIETIAFATGYQERSLPRNGYSDMARTYMFNWDSRGVYNSSSSSGGRVVIWNGEGL